LKLNLVVQIKLEIINHTEFDSILSARSSDDSESVKDEVSRIVEDVKKHGDSAVIKYSKIFDRELPESIEVTDVLKENCFRTLSQKELLSLRNSATSIRKFAEAQMKAIRPFTIRRSGLISGQLIVPVERAGCYIRGKNSPFPIRALMTIIPAKTAGVSEIIVCTPNIKPATISAAALAGANRIFMVGGAQAIAAMAYGTEKIPRVDVIAGSGSMYVAAAKKIVSGDASVDMPDGEPQLLIIADESADPVYIAADMIAQAEQDAESLIICTTTSREIAFRIRASIETQCDKFENGALLRKIIEEKGLIIVTPALSDSARIANKIAPAHLELHVKDVEGAIMLLTHFGSLYLGKYSAKVFGDFCTGPNHMSPGSGFSRFQSGLSPRNFVKFQTFQEVRSSGLSRFYRTASRLAETEKKPCGKNAMSVRLFRKK
jgi:histidinol dehydrogenase